MVVFLILILSCMLGWLLWRRLGRTRLHPLLRFVLTLLFSALVYILLFWISVYVAFFLSQRNG